MDDYTHEDMPEPRESRHLLESTRPLPSLSKAERDFWRRAVAIERARQNCGGPAPFPFQDY
jgi:hypothetical protein